MKRRRVALAVAFAALGVCANARAQTELTVRTLEHGDWADAVAALQHDPSAEGRSIHVVVESGGERAPCGRYFLMLDAYAQMAFASMGCDPRSQATTLRLVQRSALFELGDIVARPRIVQVAAFELRQATAQGRATAPASAELRCSVGLRPFLFDLLRGIQVRATPDRFEVRAIGDGAEVHVTGDAWTVRSGSMRFDYELVDRRTGELVLREAVSLSCSAAPIDAAPVDAAPVDAAPVAAAPVAAAPIDTEHHLDARAGGLPIERTLQRGPSRYHGRCGGEHAPEHVYTLHVGTPMWVALRVESHFDAIVSVRNAEGRELDCSIVTGDPGQVRVPRAWAQLAPGTYYVIIDAASGELTDGWYRLAMDLARTR